ncbi:alpha/beta hydrolase family protein [Nocardia jiangxiensis]|uniref:Alpha/beta hydrolase family protein n=1 Tax=Nocardia jiangxiensis TaxID=282685 RepID=A0ABW6SBF6_9NOCA
MPGLLVAARDERPGPYMVQFNGLDSTKEMVYGTGPAQQYLARGISTLIIDQPGTGETLRFNGIAEAERCGAACIDYLTERRDCDPEHIGVGGWSLGGYFAPRAAAFEPRFELCAAWGAIYDAAYPPFLSAQAVKGYRQIVESVTAVRWS